MEIKENTIESWGRAGRDISLLEMISQFGLSNDSKRERLVTCRSSHPWGLSVLDAETERLRRADTQQEREQRQTAASPSRKNASKGMLPKKSVLGQGNSMGRAPCLCQGPVEGMPAVSCQRGP